MSESVVADFVARFSCELSTRDEPARGRVILSQRRLVLAVDDDDKMTVPLSSVFDVAVGHVPRNLEAFFDSSVTVAFERDGDRYVAAVEADDETIEKFATVLFKAILNGTGMTVKHPARVGGRVTDAAFRPAKLYLKAGTVRFAGPDGNLDVDLARVSGFDRSNRTVDGADRPVLEIRHVDDGRSTMTLAATDTPRELAILGRYLRLEYADLVEEVGELDLTDDEREILVAIYSGAGDETLAGVVGADGSQVTMLLNRLAERGLVSEGADGTTLTPKGRVAVSTQLEDVNA